MLAYFRPPVYAFKARQQLSGWRQKGNITEYVTGFLQRLTECADVEEAEALYRFLEGLKPEVQRWVRNTKPTSLADATQAAEELGGTLQATNAGRNYRGGRDRVRAVPVAVHRNSDVVPMELGTSAGRFSGQCWKCGRTGHKAADCRSAAAQPTTQPSNKSKGKFARGKGQVANL